MSNSFKSRKPRNHDKRSHWYEYSGWIFESNREQRRRIKREVDKAMKDPDHEHEVIVELKGPKGAYDWC